MSFDGLTLPQKKKIYFIVNVKENCLGYEVNKKYVIWGNIMRRDVYLG